MGAAAKTMGVAELRCDECGTNYPSREWFEPDGVCLKCHARRAGEVPAEPTRALPAERSIPQPDLGALRSASGLLIFLAFLTAIIGFIAAMAMLFSGRVVTAAGIGALAIVDFILMIAMAHVIRLLLVVEFRTRAIPEPRAVSTTSGNP